MSEPTYPDLAAYLRGERCTLTRLAEELELSVPYLSELTRGKKQPSLPLALRIAQRCRIPIESLLRREIIA